MSARRVLDEIVVEGRVRLGRELRLDEAPEPLPRQFSYLWGRPEDGSVPAFDYDPPLAPPGQLPRQPLKASLAETGGELYLAGAGLKSSYGIFGAPGSGKTNLVLHLLRQLLAHERDRDDRKFGALILDPKASLIDPVERMVAEVGRLDDLVVLNVDRLVAENRAVNLIDCDADPYELGRLLVLAAQSAGVEASEPFWFLSWSNLFGGILTLLNLLDTEVVTLRRLVDVTLSYEHGARSFGLDPAAGPERKIQALLDLAEHRVPTLEEGQRRDVEQAIDDIRRFYAQDYVGTVEEFIRRAYGPFLQSSLACFSPAAPPSKLQPRTRFYDQIIEEGKLVLVSLSPARSDLARTLCTLVKCMFQHSLLSRRERVASGRLGNFSRPVMLACDEYGEIASEVPGQPMGDGHFFSLAREFGCMGLIATQSVNRLQSSSLKDAWRDVFSNFNAKIFMAARDNETAKEASELAGQTTWYLASDGTSRSKDGLSSSRQRELREQTSLPTRVLTHVLQRGQAVVIGTLDGLTASTYFLQVPKAAT
jgi:hypothetical protein